MLPLLGYAIPDHHWYWRGQFRNVPDDVADARALSPLLEAFVAYERSEMTQALSQLRLARLVLVRGAFEENLWLGLEYVWEGRLDQAVLAFQEAARLSDRVRPYVIVQMTLTEVYLRQGKVDEAVQVLTPLSQGQGALHQNERGCWLLLQTALQRAQGRSRDADHQQLLQAWATCRELNQRYVEIEVLLAMAQTAWHRRRYETVAAYLELIQRLVDPMEWPRMNNLAQRLEQDARLVHRCPLGWQEWKRIFLPNPRHSSRNPHLE